MLVAKMIPFERRMHTGLICTLDKMFVINKPYVMENYLQIFDSLQSILSINLNFVKCVWSGWFFWLIHYIMPLQHISGHIQAMFYKFCGLFKTFMPPKKTGCRKHIQFLGYICLVSKKGVTDWNLNPIAYRIEHKIMQSATCNDI